jgi:hypothetical protein
LVTAIALAATGLSLAWLVVVSRAQGGDIEVNKTLEGSQTVRVGEVITFHITIRNNTPFSLTTVPLTDSFRADILSPAPILVDPPFDSLTLVGSSGIISWTDIAANFGGFIVPGQTVTVTLAFTAEHPTQQLTVVNQAAVHDAINIRGESGFEGDDETENETVGGSAPLTKSVDPPGYTPGVGLPVTFTIAIKNDGAADLTFLPLVDTYDPSLLAFNFAVPGPDLVVTTTGVISWADLTTFFGPIPGDTTITVTTVFTLIDMSGTPGILNQVQIAGAQDEYSNDLGQGRDQVPIQILLPPAAPSTPVPSDDDTEKPTATPMPTPTPSPTPFPTPIFPTVLPETGAPPTAWPVAIVGLLLGLVGWYVAKRGSGTAPS